MIVRSESWPPPADPRRAALVAVAAVALFLGSWGLLHVGFWSRGQIVDTPVYQGYGDAIAHGRVPYRDFALEYPPGALPVFALPALGQSGEDDASGFRAVFEMLMWVCGAGAMAAMALTLRGLGSGGGRVAAALGFAALAPLALGSVVLTRFDLWPAALTALALAALVGERSRLGYGLLGLAAATKVYPVVLLPLALAYVWRREGRREAAVCLGAFIAVVAALFVPFLALGPDGVWASVVRQATRGLQIESLGSALLLAAHQVGGLSLTMRSGHGSQNLAGTAPEVIGALQTLVQAAVLVALWIWFARGPAERERLVRASAAAVVAFVAVGKVLSPQYLIWLVPLVPLVRGRRGLAASALLALALVLTQLWFPYRYWELALGFDGVASWLVLGRDAVLLAVLAVLVWPGRASRRVGAGRVAPGPARGAG